MEVVNGTVVSLSTKGIVSKAGKSLTIHYIDVDNGSGVRPVNIGFKPLYEVGATVSLNCDFKFNELQVLRPGAAPTASEAAAPTPIGRAARTFPVARDSHEMCIIRQSSLKAACELVGRATGAITGPVNWDELAEAAITMSYKFAEFSSGQREQSAADAIGEIDVTST